MRNFAYQSAYDLLAQANSRCAGAYVQWSWKLQDGSEPAVVLSWEVDDRSKHRQFSFTAGGRTFEAALVCLAEQFAKSTPAKDLKLDLKPYDVELFAAMTALDGCEVRLECMENRCVSLSAYKGGVHQLTVDEASCNDAMAKLARMLPAKQASQLEHPLRFASQWRFLERKLQYYWTESTCLKKVAATAPDGTPDMISPASNTQTRTFLHCGEFDPELVHEVCSGVTFEAALDAFAVSLGWKEEA